jgi:Glycosyltransferase like family 2
MLRRVLLGAVTALGLWSILPGTAGAQPAGPTTTGPPVTTASPTTAGPPTTAAPATTARPPAPTSRPATTRPATTRPATRLRRPLGGGEATGSLPAATAPGAGRVTPPARPAGGSTIVDPALPPAQVGKVPEVAVGGPASSGGPGRGLLRWAGGLARRPWQLAPMGLMGLVSWTVWLVRRLLSVRYRPVVNHHRTTTSVVVPAYREDPEVLERCLRTWYRERPDEIVIVPDVQDAEVIERLERFSLADPRIRVLPLEHRGKRSALAAGIRAARYDVVVLADSDTAWEAGLLAAVQMPFVDPMVGGVGTRQRVYQRDTSVWRRVADWLVGVRYLDYQPAQSRAGGVACLSGRTAAYRRALLLPLLPSLEREIFMGRECVAGDDGRLTWLVLSAGYRTVYQSSARAVSMFPNSMRAFFKQRVRWSRNSYRCYLTSIAKGWLWRQPFITQVTVLQVLLTPFSMATALLAVWFAAAGSGLAAGLLAVAWVLCGRTIRGFSHLREHPRDLLIAPVVAVVVIVVALPVKTWALLTMNSHGWLTRESDRLGGEGQDQASLAS